LEALASESLSHGENKDAQDYLERALLSDKSNASINFRLALLYLAAGRFKQARVAYNLSSSSDDTFIRRSSILQIAWIDGQLKAGFKPEPGPKGP
jgi:thioredoxin-like negative regulator of GroEL